MKMNRYSRHIILSEIGQTGQDKLANAKVLVVGAGGLGCPVLQYLTAAGIGTIGIIDFDVVEESNLQRQVLYGTSSLGKNKAIAAKERLADLNDTIKIHAYSEKLTHAFALDLFEDYDIIVDGTDNFSTRYLINDASIITNKPVVFGAIYKFEGQVAVFNHNNGPSYRCLFPNAPKQGSVPNCSEIGVLGVLPGIVGSLQANEVLKIILGLGDVLSGKMLCYNALTNDFTTLNISRVESEIQDVISNKEQFHNMEENSVCNSLPIEISIEEAMKTKKAQFIDVREFDEFPKVGFLNPTKIPLGELENNLNKIDSTKEKFVFCQAGVRSKTAVEILQKHNIHKSYSIKEGASEILYFLRKRK